METEKKPKRKRKRIRRILIIAASVLAVMAAAFWIYQKLGRKPLPLSEA